METQKPNAPQRNSAAVKPGSNVRGIKNAFLVIIACFVVAVILFLFVFGNPSHFDAEGYEGASMMIVFFLFDEGCRPVRGTSHPDGSFYLLRK